MKKYIIAASIIAMTASASFADTVKATITRVEPNYGYRDVSVPVERCEDVEVPIYGKTRGSGASGGDVLGGMILGALIGKGASGNDKGAAAGAVLGGVIAADRKGPQQVITGYRIDRRCTTVQNTTTERFLRNNQIWFTWNGIEGTAYTYQEYRTGQRIKVRVTLAAF